MCFLHALKRIHCFLFHPSHFCSSPGGTFWYTTFCGFTHLHIEVQLDGAKHTADSTLTSPSSLYAPANGSHGYIITL